MHEEKTPLQVVYDCALLPLLGAERFEFATELNQWLASDQFANVVICDTRLNSDIVSNIRTRDKHVFIIAVVGSLLDANAQCLHKKGADAVLNTDELQSERLQWLIERHAHSAGHKEKYLSVADIQHCTRSELMRHIIFLRNLLDSIPQLMFAKNADLEYIYSNRAANEFNGIDNFEKSDFTMQDLRVPSEKIDRIKTAESRLLESAGNTSSYKVNKNNQHNSLRNLQVQKKSMAIFGPEADTLSITFTDVTELDSAIKELANDRSTLEMRNNFMSALSDVSVRLMERKSIDEMMDHIAAQAVSLANADSAFVSMLSQTGQHLEIVGAAGRFVDYKGFRHEKEEGEAGLAWALEELVLMENKSEDARCIELWGSSTKRCAVPFHIDNKFAGVVCVPLDSVDGSLSNYLDILKLFTRTVSLAIENTLLLNSQKSELSRNVAIGEITQAFYSASNLNEMISSFCKSLLNVFDSRHATVCRYSEDGTFTLLADWQRDGDETRQVNYVSQRLIEGSICRWCVESKQMGLVPRGVEDDRDSEAMHKIKKVLGIGCSVTLPLMHDDAVWGVLFLGKGHDRKDFTSVELSLLELLTTQLSSSVMRQKLLDRIHFQAFHDSLTQLPNRLNFENTLHAIVDADTEGSEKFALMFLDLDGFKSVNDNQGHKVGDELLKRVSKRLNGCLAEKDLIARMGGDEFAVLLRGVKSKRDAMAIADRLSEAIERKYVVENYNLKIGVSIGVSFYPDNGRTVGDLLRNADFAMYEAKAAGDGLVRSFNTNMANQYRDRVALENDLLCAVEEQQFELHYQPKVDFGSQRVFGVEALLRWNHPERGFVSPAVFVPLAEEAGYITSIGNWVLQEAVEQMVHWNKEGLKGLSVAVNISSPQFVLDDFAERVINLLQSRNMDASQLELEVTESVVMNNVSKVIGTLEQLRAAGITIAIDDFGTGYSSLAYLETLPLDCMKIDKLFVDKLDTGSSKFSLVNSILTMAGSFGLRTVAEGVETEEQVEKLLSLGCECIQGYYFSPPVQAADVRATIDRIEQQLCTLKKAG